MRAAWLMLDWLHLSSEGALEKKGIFSVSFLAVQNSSIGDLVTHSLSHSVTKGTFTFDITE